jgi:hypothetical protein
MALLSDMDITVCQRRVDSGSYKQSGGGSGGQRKTKISAKTKYLVVVAKKSGGPSLTPSDLNPLLIINHPSIPRIGRTCYSFGGLIAPFLLCSNKTIDRDAENPFVFHVSVDWESIEVGVGGGSSEVGEETPQEALEPKPEEEFDTVPDPVASFTTSSTEIVLYEADFVTRGYEKRQSWKLPTGTPFQEPITRKVPLITISLTQFEDEFTLTDLEKRSFSVNMERWNSRGDGQWLIAEVQAEEVTLNLQDGEVDMWRVTYTIHLAPDNPVKVIVDGEPAIGPNGEGWNEGELFYPGWATLRPLVDTFYKKEDTPPSGPPGPDYLVPNADEKTGYVEACYIYEATGRKRTPTSTDGTGDDRPSYMAFMSYRYSDFNEFLQWPK